MKQNTSNNYNNVNEENTELRKEHMINPVSREQVRKQHASLFLIEVGDYRSKMMAEGYSEITEQRSQ